MPANKMLRDGPVSGKGWKMFSGQAKTSTTTPDDGHSEELLGNLLEAALANIGATAEDLAQALDVEEEFVEALLEGMIPANVLSDDLLTEVAGFIGYETNLLRIMLRREVEPYQDYATQQHSGTTFDDSTLHCAGTIYFCGPGCAGHSSFAEHCSRHDFNVALEMIHTPFNPWVNPHSPQALAAFLQWQEQLDITVQLQETLENHPREEIPSGEAPLPELPLEAHVTPETPPLPFFTDTAEDESSDLYWWIPPLKAQALNHI